MKSLLAFLILTMGFSAAQAQETEYEKVDSFYMHRNLSTQSKIEVNISGSKDGAVAEVLSYLIKSKTPRANVEGDLIFKGSKAFRISLRYFGINMLLEPMDYFAASTSEAGTVITIGGFQAKYITEKMVEAGLEKIPYKGDSNSFSVKGRLVSCSNSVGIMGYTCSFSMTSAK